MTSILTAHDIHAAIHNKINTRPDPNTSTKYHGLDSPNSISTHRNTRHLTQDYDWSQHDITYEWNTYGFRGKDPKFNSDKRMLIIGNSMSLGEGMPIELTFVNILAKKLNTDYLNLSEFYALTDALDYAELIKKYNPDTVLICPGRFMSGSDLLINYSMLQLPKFQNIELQTLSSDVMKNSVGKDLFMFELAIKKLANTDNIYWLIHGIKDKPKAPFSGSDVWKLVQGKKCHIIPKKDFTDLARDNAHPGINSHKNISEKLFNLIGDTHV